MTIAQAVEIALSLNLKEKVEKTVGESELMAEIAPTGFKYFMNYGNHIQFKYFA